MLFILAQRKTINLVSTEWTPFIIFILLSIQLWKAFGLFPRKLICYWNSIIISKACTKPPAWQSNTASCRTDTSPSTPDPNNINIHGQTVETMVSSSKQNIKSQGFPFAIFCHLLDKSFTFDRCQKGGAKSGTGKQP